MSEFWRPGREQGSTSLQARYEPLLWQRAEELSELRTQFAEYQTQLYEEVASMRDRRLNLHEQEMLGTKEARYWENDAKLKGITNQEDTITQALIDLESETIDEAKLKQLAPPQERDEKQLSKKKQRMQEERERLAKLGLDQREIDVDIFLEFGFESVYPFTSSSEYGSDPTNLSTGRHQNKVTGNLDTYSAENEFYYRTADTHGGKVSHSRQRNYYTTRGGKKIRKR